MNMIELTKTELEKHNALTPKLNAHIQRIVDAIPYTTVDPRMKATIAVSQLTSFASQFRKNIMLWDDTSVPINAISFIITESGSGKDSSVKAARKCFTVGHQLIEKQCKTIIREQAIKAATVAGEDIPTEFEIYKSYMKPHPPIDIMPTTDAGLIQHINDIGDLGLSTGFMYSGEVGDELAYNADMTSNIKTLSEVYDTGDKEVKYTKGIEHRSKAIKGQPVSALFVGSPSHILYDQTTKKKFHVAFMSKLARRSWFCYTPKQIIEPVFDTVEEMLEYEEQIELQAKQARASMSTYIKEVTEFGLSTTPEHITVPEEVFKLFKIYKRYNSDLADTTTNQTSTAALIRRHLQWKALKLAGAFAIFEKSNSIQQHNYIEAIQFCELLAHDMELFELDLYKSDHEQFSDYIQTQIQVDGKAIINVHDIKKQGFISSITKQKLQELITLCSTYDTKGIYSIINDNSAIQYEPIIKTDVINISFKPIDITALENAISTNNSENIKTAKYNIAKTTAYGFDTGETSFENLSELLAKSYAYSPFVFKDGVRGKNNIIGGTKWLVFDIDKSNISASETHFLLEDINHHIALSSDATNEYKFRVLIELDSIVELDPISWRHFYTIIANNLALNIDILPQSQIFFSYANRPVMSVTDQQPLEARTFITKAKEYTTNTPIKTLTSTQQKHQLADPLETFNYCFECPIDGPGSRSMIRLVNHAKNDLSASYDQVVDLLNQVQEYWEIPMPEDRFNRILQQVEQMYK